MPNIQSESPISSSSNHNQYSDSQLFLYSPYQPIFLRGPKHVMIGCVSKYVGNIEEYTEVDRRKDTNKNKSTVMIINRHHRYYYNNHEIKPNDHDYELNHDHKMQSNETMKVKLKDLQDTETLNTNKKKTGTSSTTPGTTIVHINSFANIKLNSKNGKVIEKFFQILLIYL